MIFFMFVILWIVCGRFIDCDCRSPRVKIRNTASYWVVDLDW